MSLLDIKQLHQSGRLEEAKQEYVAWLQTHPNDVTALHLLALLYIEMGDLDVAYRYLIQALEIEPKHANVQLHMANIFKAKGLYDQAIQLLEKIIQEHPNFSAAFNNMGTVYFMQKNLEKAVLAYEAAIKLQSNYIDAYYNLGLAYNKLNRKKDAKRVYEAMLELVPEHVGAHFQLASLLMQEENYSSALKHLSVITNMHAFHVETKTNLATCLFKLGRLSEARSCYLEALALSPNDTQLFFNLGVIEAKRGHMHSATDFYLQALNINPHFFEAHYNLGVLSLRTKGPEVALTHFQEALRIQPGHTIVQHLINILTPDKHLSTLPADFVGSLFDAYADHYDVHLTDVLHYQLPQRFFKWIVELTNDAYRQWHILDLGCGTGLCGKYFKTETNKVIGVDISKNMLDRAAAKPIYDEFILSDIQSFLNDKNNLYDLILAGDVLGYIGELSILFSRVNQALKTQGFFLFSAEMNEEEGFQVTAFGRFVYSRSYLNQMLMQHHFTIVRYEVVALRVENNTPVLEHVYLVRK